MFSSHVTIVFPIKTFRKLLKILMLLTTSNGERGMGNVKRGKGKTENRERKKKQPAGNKIKWRELETRGDWSLGKVYSGSPS